MTSKRHARMGLAAVAVAASFAVAGCGADGDAEPRMRKVDIDSFMFRPVRIEIPLDGTVVWRNLDKAQHTATAKEGSGSQFDTGTLRREESRSVRFTEKGTVEYVCAFHAFMNGTVEVK